MFDLGRLLWKQGVIYLFVATIAEIPPAVFLFLNLNDFFFSTDIGNGSDEPPKRMVTNTKWTTTIPPSPSRMEVTVHTSCEDWRCPASQTGQHAPYMTRSSDGQHGDKLHELDLNDDAESNVTWGK